MSAAVEEDLSLFSRKYVPAPSKPDGFDESVKSITGTIESGESRVLVGWGMDLRDFRNENPEAVKYPGPFRIHGIDRWVLEVWRPPEFFGSPDEWETTLRYSYSVAGRKMDCLGPFPRAGKHVMVMPLITPAGGFIPLGEAVLDFIRQKHKQFEETPLNAYTWLEQCNRLQEEAALDEREAEEEAEREAQAWDDYVLPRWEKINTERMHSIPDKQAIITGNAALNEFNQLKGH